MPHQPYRPFIAPCEILLFPKMQSHVKGTLHHRGVEEVKETYRDAEMAFLYRIIKGL